MRVKVSTHEVVDALQSAQQAQGSASKGGRLPLPQSIKDENFCQDEGWAFGLSSWSRVQARLVRPKWIKLGAESTMHTPVHPRHFSSMYCKPQALYQVPKTVAAMQEYPGSTHTSKCAPSPTQGCVPCSGLAPHRL